MNQPDYTETPNQAGDESSSLQMQHNPSAKKRLTKTHLVLFVLVDLLIVGGFVYWFTLQQISQEDHMTISQSQYESESAMSSDGKEGGDEASDKDGADVQPSSEGEGDTAPAQISSVLNLSFTDYDGNDVQLSDYVGTPMVVNAWASWCPFCKAELPDMATVQNKFGDDVIVVAINREESLERAKQFTDSIETTDTLTTLLDPDDSFYKEINGFSMPETLFIDSNGAVSFHKRGFMDLEELLERTEALL